MMGILNVTPDSFHADSRVTGQQAVERGVAMFENGATWVDVGGESTRPGADAVSVDEECARVIPVILGLKQARPDGWCRSTRATRPSLKPPLRRVQTWSTTSAVFETRDDGRRARSRAAVCIMHMLGTPKTMQHDIQYNDVVNDVHEALFTTARELVSRGHPAELICLDPGIGFGKSSTTTSPCWNRGTPQRWRAMERAVGRLTQIGGRAPDRSCERRRQVAGSLGLAALACLRGVGVLRVHDVAPHRDLLNALRPSRSEGDPTGVGAGCNPRSEHGAKVGQGGDQQNAPALLVQKSLMRSSLRNCVKSSALGSTTRSWT